MKRDRGVAGVTQLLVTNATAQGKVPHRRLRRRTTRKEQSHRSSARHRDTRAWAQGADTGPLDDDALSLRGARAPERARGGAATSSSVRPWSQPLLLCVLAQER